MIQGNSLSRLAPSVCIDARVTTGLRLGPTSEDVSRCQPLEPPATGASHTLATQPPSADASSSSLSLSRLLWSLPAVSRRSHCDQHYPVSRVTLCILCTLHCVIVLTCHCCYCTLWLVLQSPSPGRPGATIVAARLTQFPPAGPALSRSRSHFGQHYPVSGRAWHQLCTRPGTGRAQSIASLQTHTPHPAVVQTQLRSGTEDHRYMSVTPGYHSDISSDQ